MAAGGDEDETAPEETETKEESAEEGGAESFDDEAALEIIEAESLPEEQIDEPAEEEQTAEEPEEETTEEEAEEELAEAEEEPPIGTLTITPKRGKALLSYDFRLEAKYKPADGGGEIDVTGDAQWSSLDEGKIKPYEQTNGLFKAAGEGKTTIKAVYLGAEAAQEITIYARPVYEARGVWVNRWTFSSAAEVKKIIQNCAAWGFNQVYFQVRGRADAFYKSAYEPWASELSGTLGKDPGWDPLQTAIDAAKAEGVELHAWINALTVWNGSTAPSANASPKHLYYTHPDWIMADSSGAPMPLGSEYIFVSPGNPAVWEYLADIVEDIIAKYDVDGVHLDRIRYPGPGYSYDETSNALYNQAHSSDSSLTRGKWQTGQLNALVAAVYNRIALVKPYVVLSAATWGIYLDTRGWNSSEGLTEYYQDPYAWDAAGTIDAIIPMIYWHTRSTYGSYTDFNFLIDDHTARAKKRFVYAGSDFEDSSFSGGYIDAAELGKQINKTRSTTAMGHVFYDYGTLQKAGLTEEFASGIYKEPAVVPFMDWKPAK